MKKTAALIIAISFGAILTGCEAEQTEKDMVLEAQFCLDEATNGTQAQACISKISGLNSALANTLRCAAGFIEAEITSPSRLSNALNAISAEGSGAPDLMAALNFGDVGLANRTFTSCNASGQNGLKLISAMAKSATILSNVAVGLPSCSSLTSCDSTAIKDTLADLQTRLATPGDTAAEDAVIEIVTSVRDVYTSTCSGSVKANGDICNQLTEAIAASGQDIVNASHPQLLEIGKALLAKWEE